MTLPFHSYADIFPLIEGEAFEELVADVREHGIRERIVLHAGQILDGRNRYRAAIACGLIDADDEVTIGGATFNRHFRILGPAKDGEPLAFVLSKNLRRRHLDESQRALVAARIATLSPGRPPLPASPTRGEGSSFSIDAFAAEAEEVHGGGDAVDRSSDAVDDNADAVDGRADSVVGAADNGAPGNPANLRGFSQADAAQLLSVSERSVSSARVVVTEGVAELGRAVERGEIAVSAAAEIARLPVEEQRALIEAADPKAFAAVAKARRGERQAEKKARRERREAELGQRQRALPDKRYGVIYADPEWRYEPWDRGSGMDRAADNHYPTTPTAEIMARPVASIAADDCALFLWATVPMLTDALAVLAAWGFQYKSHLVWHKRRAGAARGPGYWFTNEHEVLLLGVKGNPPCPAPGKQWASLVAADVAEHSVKPDEFVWMIEEYFPNLPKIELNARRRRDGWDAWGLEAPEASAVGSGQSAVGEGRDSPATASEMVGGFPVAAASYHAEVTGGVVAPENKALPASGSRPRRSDFARPVNAAGGESVTAGETASSPTVEDDPDIPTYLKRGHPDCPVRAASGQEGESKGGGERKAGARHQDDDGELIGSDGFPDARHQRPPRADTTNGREENGGRSGGRKGGVASNTYHVETLGMVDPGTYRRTPDGEPTVPELVPPGSIVRTSYGTGPYIVVRVSGPFFYDPSHAADRFHRSTQAAPEGRETFPHWSLELRRVDEFDPKRPLAGGSFVNECVALGGRVRMLFGNNDDEVLVDGIDAAAAAAIVPALALRERVSIDGDDGSVTAAELTVLSAKAEALPWKRLAGGDPRETVTVTWFEDGGFAATVIGPAVAGRTAKASLTLVRRDGHVEVVGETFDGCGYMGGCLSVGRVRKFLRAWGKAAS